jgi:polysaccharide export outer membrane protein
MTGLAGLAGCGSGGEGTAFSPVGSGTLQNAASASTEVPQRGDYKIMTDDILQIVVYQVPDFSREVQVDGAGSIVLPLLGGIPASGRTVRELESDLIRRLKVKYVQNPQVSIVVKDAVGLRVTVSGAVAKPGIIQLRGNMTLMSALAQSGGFSDTADQSNVVVFRETSQGRAAARFNANSIREGSAADPPIYAGDTILVDDSTFKSALKQSGPVISGVGVFRLLF